MRRLWPIRVRSPWCRLAHLTNIGLALRLEPKIAEMAKEVIIMGGAAYVPGNITPLAEANIYHDPHAAQMVFSAGWQVTMVGLDATHQVVMQNSHFDKIFSANNPAANLLREITPCYRSFFDEVYALDGAVYTHDPSAVAYAIDPSLFEVRTAPIVMGN